ncbi:MAG: ankyrin repeat domain-containing protein, partial [Bacteroidota bacterium]
MTSYNPKHLYLLFFSLPAICISLEATSELHNAHPEPKDQLINPWMPIPGSNFTIFSIKLPLLSSSSSLFDAVYAGQHKKVHWLLTESGLAFDLFKVFRQYDYQYDAKTRKKMSKWDGYMIINVAVALGDLAMFEILWRHNPKLAEQTMEKAFSLETASNSFHVATYKNQANIVKFLLNEKHRPKTVSMLFRQLFNSYFTKDLEEIIKKYIGYTGPPVKYTRIAITKFDHWHSGNLPIHFASMEGLPHMVEILLRHDPLSAKIENESSFNACQLAAMKNHSEVVEVFLRLAPACIYQKRTSNKDASDLRTTFLLAVRYGSYDVVDCLLAYDKDLFKEKVRGNDEPYSLTNQHITDGFNAYHLAIFNFHPSVIKVLLKHDPTGRFVNQLVDNIKNIECNGFGALHIALSKETSDKDKQERKKEIIRLLLEYALKKDPAFAAQRVALRHRYGFASTSLSRRDRSGYTAFHMLIDNFSLDYFEILDLFLTYAPELLSLRVENDKSEFDGCTPIYMALAMCCLSQKLPEKRKLVAQLLKSDPSPRTNLMEKGGLYCKGLNPLQFAIFKLGWFDEVGEVLAPYYLSQVVEEEQSFYKGMNALEIAIQNDLQGNNSPEIVRRLLPYDPDGTVAQHTLQSLRTMDKEKKEMRKLNLIVLLLKGHIQKVRTKKKELYACTIFLS